MRHLLLISVILLSFAPTFAQPPAGRGVLYGIGVGTTQYGEFDVQMEASLIRSHPKFYVSVNADVFNAVRPKGINWTTAQIGGRLNYVLLRHSKAHRLVLFGGGKYATQGREQAGMLNAWLFDAGFGYLYNIPTRKYDNVWLRFNTFYENTPNERLFLSLGIQTIF
jgi:hypothetical protein